MKPTSSLSIIILQCIADTKVLEVGYCFHVKFYYTPIPYCRWITVASICIWCRDKPYYRPTCMVPFNKAHTTYYINCSSFNRSSPMMTRCGTGGSSSRTTHSSGWIGVALRNNIIYYLRSFLFFKLFLSIFSC